jgi:hypothetical protein
MLLLRSAVLLAIVVGATGLAPGVLVGRTRSWALLVAPACAAVVCSLAVGLSLATRSALLPWVLLLGALGWTALAVQVVRRRVPLLPPPGEGGWLVFVPVVLVALAPVLLAQMPLSEIDARNIWWYHASWFRAGGEAAWTAIHEPANDGTHPAYPPLVPGLIASAWGFGGAYDVGVALAVTQLFTASGVAVLSFATTQVAHVRRHAGAFLAVVVGLVAWGSAVVVGLNGLVDLTWAVFAVAGAVLLLAGDADDRRTLATGVLLLAVAAGTKAEGQVVAVLVLGAAVLRPRGERRLVVALGVGLGVVVGLWTLLVAPGGAADDRGDWSKAGDLLSSGSEVQRRFGDSLQSFWDELGPLVLGGALVVLVLVVVARWSGTPLRQPGLLGLLAVAAAYLAFLALTFPLREEPIELLVDLTSHRVVVFVRLVVLVDLLLAVVATARALGALPQPSPEGSSGGAGTTIAGASVPPSTSKTLPVTQEPASEAR